MSFPGHITIRYIFSCILSLLFFYSATGAAATLPPTDFTATVVGGTATLKWLAPQSPVTGYRIFRTFNGNQEPIANGYTDVSYRDSNLALGTYSYALKALGTDGTVSIAVRKDALVSDIQPPQAPATLSAKGTSTSTIDISWAQAIDNIGVTKYEIYRNGSYLTTVLGAATLGHTDKNLLPSTTYTYKVWAVDATGLTSGWSPNAVGNTLGNLTTVTLSLSSATPRAGTTLQVNASATDGDGNLKELKICEVMSSGDVCEIVATGPNSNLRGSKNTPVSNLVLRKFYATVDDAVGGTSKTSYYEALGKAHLYVDENGNDSDIPGRGSEALPFKTITAGITKANTIDTYIAVKGKYTERVIINKSNITLDGQKLATVLAPNNENLTKHPGAINVVGAGTKDVIVRGFNVGHTPVTSNMTYDQIKGYVGIFVGPDTNGVTVQDNAVRLTESSGIMVREAFNVKVLNNIVEKTNAGAANHYNGTITNLTTCKDRFDLEEKIRAKQEMISIITTDGFEVRHNNVFNGEWTINGQCVVGKEGIDAKFGSNRGRIIGNKVHDILRLGIYLDAWNTDMVDFTVDSNRVWNTRHGVVLSVEVSNTAVIRDARITNNVLYNNTQHGIYITPFCCQKAHTQGNGPRELIKIINNTLYGNGGDGILIGDRMKDEFGVSRYANIEGVAIINNLVVNNEGMQMRNMTLHKVRDLTNPSSTITADRNLVSFDSGLGQKLGNLGGQLGTPTFKDVISSNLALWNFQLVEVGGTPKAFDGIDEGYDGAVNYNTSIPLVSSIKVLIQTDATGIRRLTGSNTVLDIGAYEKH